MRWGLSCQPRRGWNGAKNVGDKQKHFKANNSWHNAFLGWLWVTPIALLLYSTSFPPYIYILTLPSPLHHFPPFLSQPTQAIINSYYFIYLLFNAWFCLSLLFHQNVVLRPGTGSAACGHVGPAVWLRRIPRRLSSCP